MINVVNKKNHIPTSCDFYIGRGSPLGNPYSHLPTEATAAKFRCESRQEAIAEYKDWLLNKIKQKDPEICDALNKIWKIAKSGDINLVCYCNPKQCHGEVIKEIVEEKICIKI